MLSIRIYSFQVNAYHWAFTFATTSEQVTAVGGGCGKSYGTVEGESAIALSCKIRTKCSISPCSPPSRAEISTWSDTFRRLSLRAVFRTTTMMSYNVKVGENRRTVWNLFPLDCHDCVGSSS